MEKQPGKRWRKLPWYLRYRVGARLASSLRKSVIRLTHLHCHVQFQGPVYLGPGFRLDIPDEGSFIVGPGVVFRGGFVCEISGQGRVHIGAGTVFTSDALLQCTTSIDIGERCAFGQALQIVDGNHRFRDLGTLPLEQGYEYRPITIGNDVLVHSKCTIINSIGDRAIVGANTVVTRQIPAYSVAVGAPARVIEYFGPPERRPAELQPDV